MTRVLVEAQVFMVRSLKRTIRSRGLIISLLFQPLVYLVLFSQIFRTLADEPQFEAAGYRSYLMFFLPGLLVLGAMVPGLSSGMGVVVDNVTGMLDSFLRTPIHRSSILVGRMFADAARVIIQACVLFVTAFALGARFPTGVAGILVTLVLLVLFSLVLSGLSNFVALRTGSVETTGALTNFLVLPLIFLSTAMMPASSLPGWMRFATKLNPATYVIESSRTALNFRLDWVEIGQAFAVCGGLVLVMAVLVARSYQATLSR